MNAYELAEQAEGLAYEIPADWSSGEPKNVATDIANMLRQQADRIKDLEKLLEHSVGADCREMRYIQEIENKDARIAELEKDLEGCEYFLDKQQSAEPVAWLWIHNGTTMNALLRNPSYDERSKENWVKKGWISKPLYTTPQIKELSDEEILQQAEWMFGTHFFEMIDDQYWIEFAKAILKKASQ